MRVLGEALTGLWPYNLFLGYSVGDRIWHYATKNGYSYIIWECIGSQPFGEPFDAQYWKPIPLTILPPVSSTDNGKFLRVVSGQWSAVTVPSASGNSF